MADSGDDKSETGGTTMEQRIKDLELQVAELLNKLQNERDEKEKIRRKYSSVSAALSIIGKPVSTLVEMIGKKNLELNKQAEQIQLLQYELTKARIFATKDKIEESDQVKRVQTSFNRILVDCPAVSSKLQDLAINEGNEMLHLRKIPDHLRLGSE